MIAYTSGTTAPQGAVHVHGGFLVKMASEAFYQADLHPDETLYWVTDMGWIMGPWEMIGAGCAGATVVLYEGAPDWPARSGVGFGGTPPGERAGGVAHADPGAQDAGRRARAATPRACGSSDRRASPGTPSRTSGFQRWWAAGACRSSTFPAAPRSARASSLRIPSRRSRSARSAARPMAWTSTSSTRRGAPSAGGRRARVQASVAGHDAWDLGRPRALHRDLLVHVRGSGGTGTGRSSTSRATGSCWGAPTTRSTWPGSGSDRPRSSRCSYRIRR